MKLSKNRWVLAIGLIVVAVGGYLWFKKTQVNEPLVTVSPAYADLTESLNVSGTIDAYEKVDLKFAAPAKLSWVGITEGQTVKKYQGIASQDTQAVRKQLQLSLNNFAKQFITHDETLAEYDYYNNPSVDLELKRILEKAQYDLDNAVLQVELSDLAVKLSTLSSPVAGIVTHVSQPYAGVTITPADTFQIVNPSTIYFSVVVDEADISKVVPQQPVKIILDAYPDDVYTGKVERVDFGSSISESGGIGYKVYISFPETNADMKFKLGMNGTADIILNQKDQVLAVPTDSLISRDNKYYVDVALDGKPVRKEITIGIESDSQVEVISGVSLNDLVVLPKAQ